MNITTLKENALTQCLDRMRYKQDLTVENIKGRFIEYPISSIKVSPLFFWKFAFKKLFRSNNSSQ